MLAVLWSGVVTFATGELPWVYENESLESLEVALRVPPVGWGLPPEPLLAKYELAIFGSVPTKIKDLPVIANWKTVIVPLPWASHPSSVAVKFPEACPALMPVK